MPQLAAAPSSCRPAPPTKGHRGFGVWGLGFGVWGSGFGVWGLGFGVWGLGFGAWDVGLQGLGVSGLYGGLLGVKSHEDMRVPSTGVLHVATAGIFFRLGLSPKLPKPEAPSPGLLYSKP